MNRIIIGIFLFCLLHFENLDFGLIKISILWKLLLTFGLIINLIKQNAKIRLYRPFLLLFIISLVQIFYDLESLKLSVIFLLFYLSGNFLLNLKEDKILSVINYLRFFLVFVFVPYHFFGLESLGSVYDLEKYDGGLALTGPFANPHTASMMLAIIGIVNFYFFKNFTLSKQSKSINLFLLFLTVYFLINTFVRTGIFMFIFGLLPLIFNRLSFKTIFSGIITVVITGTLILNFLTKDSVIYKRMTGESKYNKEESFEQYGSGRGLLLLHGINIIQSYDNSLNYIFGIGETNLIQEIKYRTSNPIVTHNGFLDITIIHGFLGLIIFVGFFYKNHVFLYSSKSPFKVLGYSVLITILVMIFFQDHKRFYSFIILFLINSLIYKNYENKKIIL